MEDFIKDNYQNTAPQKKGDTGVDLITKFWMKSGLVAGLHFYLYGPSNGIVTQKDLSGIDAIKLQVPYQIKLYNNQISNWNNILVEFEKYKRYDASSSWMKVSDGMLSPEYKAQKLLFGDELLNRFYEFDIPQLKQLCRDNSFEVHPSPPEPSNDGTETQSLCYRVPVPWLRHLGLMNEYIDLNDFKIHSEWEDLEEFFK